MDQQNEAINAPMSLVESPISVNFSPENLVEQVEESIFETRTKLLQKFEEVIEQIESQEF